MTDEIAWTNARAILRDIGMPNLDWAHGRAVDIVRWCLNTKGRPSNQRQAFLEAESLPLLTYLETLATSGDSSGWRTLQERIMLQAEALREMDALQCRRPWLAAIWHCLPELAAIGRTILDTPKEPTSVAALEVSSAPAHGDADSDNGGDDKGSTGNSGAAGTIAKPMPLSKLALPVVSVVLTDAEKKALCLGKPASDTDARNEVTSEGPDGTNRTSRPKMPGGSK